MEIQGKYRFEGNSLDSSGNLNNATTGVYQDELIGKMLVSSTIEIPKDGIDVLNLTVCFNIMWYYIFDNDDIEYFIFKVVDSSNNVIHALSTFNNEIIITLFGNKVFSGSYITTSDISDYITLRFGYNSGNKFYSFESKELSGFSGGASDVTPSNVIDKIQLSGINSVDEFVIGKDDLVDVDFRRMSIGLMPFYSTLTSSKWYGVEFDTTVSSTALKRIGNLDLHGDLPYHSKIRHCLLNNDGTVNYYTHPENQGLKEDGVTPADLSGADGQRMVHFPESYWKFRKEGTKRRVMLSEYPLLGFFRVAEFFVSPDGACMHRPSGKLSSVVTASPDYRGGNNNAAWDLESRTLLQKEATAMSLAAFRNAARLRGPGWEGYNIQGHELITWLIRIEYANLNCQLAYNPVLDANGFRQGGLGPGVTNLISADWTAFNSQYPFLPTGIGASLGNGTGIVPFDMPVEYKTPTVQVQVPVWRGIANPFGHIWKWLDGVLFNFQADDAGGESRLYTAYDRSKFSSTSFADYDYRGLAPRNDGYVRDILFDDMGGFFPSVTTGGSSATYFSDYWYQSVPASGVSLRGCRVGGASLSGAHAGLGCTNSYNAPSDASAPFGSRLCFFGA